MLSLSTQSCQAFVNRTPDTILCIYWTAKTQKKRPVPIGFAGLVSEGFFGQAVSAVVIEQIRDGALANSQTFGDLPEAQTF